MKTMLSILPTELLHYIHEFDDQDKTNYAKCIRELDQAIGDRNMCLSTICNERQVRHHTRVWLSRNRQFYQFMLSRNMARKRLALI